MPLLSTEADEDQSGWMTSSATVQSQALLTANLGVGVYITVNTVKTLECFVTSVSILMPTTLCFLLLLLFFFTVDSRYLEVEGIL